jgi:hypothetical protein
VTPLRFPQALFSKPNACGPDHPSQPLSARRPGRPRAGGFWMALAHLGRAVYKSAAMGGLAAEGRAWRLRRHACLRRLPPTRARHAHRPHHRPRRRPWRRRSASRRAVTRQAPRQGRRFHRSSPFGLPICHQQQASGILFPVPLLWGHRTSWGGPPHLANSL